VPILKINRYQQEGPQCAIASAASIANYYDNNIDYDFVKKIVKKNMAKCLNAGLDSGECAYLLNLLGFKNVTIISSDLDLYDYSFNKYGRKKQSILLANIAKYIEGGWKASALFLSNWIKNDNYKNKIIIDYNFGNYIRKTLQNKKPLFIIYNWEMFFKVPKINSQGNKDAVKGSYESHAVVAYGFNKYGVNVCDSNMGHYKYRLKKYSRGYYRISWENLMAVMARGDLIIPDNFNY